METNPIVPGAAEEAALAVQIFESFCAASTMAKILALFREMCRVLKLKPTVIPDFYGKLKNKLAKSWRAQAIFRKLDVRSNFKIYNRGRTCANCRVLIIGGGPCGLRTAIDAQLLGAKVVVIEKRDRMTRNNILHLWPFVIQDLRNLAAKKFFGKFCAGSIDHISIRQLQFMLLKVALILGVEFHEGLNFEHMLEPKDTGPEKSGWKACFTPADHPVSNYEFDVLIAADGKRNTLSGFKRKEFRGKLAIAITANFINKHTKEEAAVPEISGTAFIFKQKFFLDLNKQFYIDLENLVYYKGETHYFVMTAKKQSLLQRNVLLKDYSETTSLLSRENINYTALREYAQDAADYSTNFQLPKLEFAINHYGQPDVAVFDFTSMFAAENASRIVEKNGHRLLVCLVGDGLLEPFWPTGSGCARGFLSSLDACWAIRSWGLGVHPLALLAERESIYRLLAQTTPQNLSPDLSHYTVDPTTRYRNLNKGAVMPHQVMCFYDTDDPTAKNIDTLELMPQVHTKKRKRDSQVHPDALLAWLRKQIVLFNLELENLVSPFKNGIILCAILHRYRPDLLEYSTLDPNKPKENIESAFDIFEKEFGLAAIPNIEEIVARNDNTDKISMILYLSQIYHLFRGEIPFIRHAREGSPEPEKKRASLLRNSVTREAIAIATESANVQSIPQIHTRTSDSENISSQRKSRKRRSSSKYHGQSIAERMKKLREKKYASEEARKRDIAKFCLISRLEAKSMRMLESNARVAQFTTPVDEDHNISEYRQNAPEFKVRVKQMEKLMNPELDRPALPIPKTALGSEFSSRLKTIESQIVDGNSGIVIKKPKDLMRAIGKIGPDDWNLKNIEEKIQENQLGRAPAHGKEKVPKWNREQFLARQTKIEQHGAEKQDVVEGKFQDIDSSLKQLDRQLKEGNILETGERGRNKVANLAAQIVKKTTDEEVPVVKATSNPKPVVVNPGRLDICHACKKKVYLMEKISPEDNLIFHKSCFKCHYCSLTLKIGSYTYDREGKFGYNFFCSHHYGMMGRTAKAAAPGAKPQIKEKKEHVPYEQPILVPIEASTPIQILNRDETPERIELENQAHDTTLSEELRDEIDEDEWSDINFGNSLALGNESSGNADDDESSSSDEEYSEAIDENQDESDYLDDSQPSDVGSDGEYTNGSSSDHFSYHEYSSGDEEGASGTEGSEQRVAREQRRQEVAIQAPPLTSSPTDTELASDEESSSETSEPANSATEVSTDSEFAHDEPTPTRDLPYIVFNDDYVCKIRGTYSKHAEENRKNNLRNAESKLRKKKTTPPLVQNTNKTSLSKVQVKTGMIVNGNVEKSNKDNKDIHLEFKLLLPAEPKPPIITIAPIGDYLLSRTQSTSGIATKRALELKKKYLLGSQSTFGLQKSDSASQLDSKFKTFHSHISECQKLLNPAPNISPSPDMQAFLDNSTKRNGTLLSPTNLSPSILFDSGPLKPKLPIFTFTSNSNSTSNSNNFDSNDSIDKNTILEDNTVLELPNITDNTISDASTNLTNDDKTPTAETINDKSKQTLCDNSVVIRPQSPLLETSIVVPNIPWSDKDKSNDENSGTDMESDSLVSGDSSSDDACSKEGAHDSIAIPRVEVRKPCGEVMQLDSLMIVDGKYSSSEDDKMQVTPSPKKSPSPSKNYEKKTEGRASPNSDSGNDITAFFTDNEALDWAVDGTSIDMECNSNTKNKSKNGKRLSKNSSWELLLSGDLEPSAHVCGKDDKKPENARNILAYDHSDIDFMDSGSEESLIENLTTSKNRELATNRGFVEFVDINVGFISYLAESPVVEAVNRHCDSPVNDRSMDFIEQGAYILKNDTYLKDLEVIEPKIDNVYKSSTETKLKENVLNETEAVIVLPVKEVKDVEVPIVKEDVKITTNLENIIIPKNNNFSFNQRLEKKEEKSTPKKEKVDIVVTTSIHKEPPIMQSDKNSNLKNLNNDVNLNVTLPVIDPLISKKSCNSPKTNRKLEEITKEKVKQKDVIHQMVMDKMSKTSLTSEKRLNRRSRTSISPECFGKKSTPLNTGMLDVKKLEDKVVVSECIKPLVNKYGSYISEVKLTLLKDKGVEDERLNNQPSRNSKLKYPSNSEAFSLPDLPQALYRENVEVSPNALNNNEVEGKLSEKKHTKYNSKDMNYHDISPFAHHVGIVPGFRQLSLDDCSGKLVQDVKFLRKSDVPHNDIFNAQSKSSGNLYTNDYSPYSAEHVKKGKNRDGERRKSIIKTVSDFFKRRDSAGHMDKKNRLPKDKYKSKSCNNLDYSEGPDHSNLDESTHMSNIQSDDDTVPPPIPPLPTNIGQFSGESENIDSSAEQHKSSCLLAFERNVKINKTENNLKVLEAKEHEMRMQYEIAKASAIKRHSHKNKAVMEQLMTLKRCVRKLQFQYEVETFLLEDLRLEEQYFELRLNLSKPLQSKRAKINKDMMDIFVKRQCLANNLNQITQRYYSRNSEDDMLEEFGLLKEACSNTK